MMDAAAAALRRRLYGSARWRKIARAQLERAPLCAFCLQQGRVTAATVCDHRVPWRGDVRKFWVGFEGLQSLCLTCHSAGKAVEEHCGYSAAIGDDGWPIDARHPIYKHR